MSRLRRRSVNINGDWEVSDNISLSPSVPRAVLVGVSSTLLVDENVRRKGLIIINGSSNRVSLAFGTDAVLDRGIILYPGGVFNMAEDDFYSGKIFGVAAGVDSLVTVQEFS